MAANVIKRYGKTEREKNLFHPTGMCESKGVPFNQRCTQVATHRLRIKGGSDRKFHYTNRDIFMPAEEQKTVRRI